MLNIIEEKTLTYSLMHSFTDWAKKAYSSPLTNTISMENMSTL